MGLDELSIADDFPAVSKGDWRERVEEGPTGKPVERLQSRTPDGLVIEPLYASEDAPARDAAGFPGLPPFVRGRSALGSAESGWQVHAEMGHPLVATAAEELRREIDHGANAVTLRVGIERGTRILTAGDFAVLLEPVDLPTTPVVLDPGMDFLPIGASLVAVARSRDVDLGALRGSFGADPLGTLAEAGRLQSGLEGTWSELAELAVWARENVPGMRVARASVVPHHEAGATPVLELAFAAATGIEYMRRLTAAGLSVDEAAERVELSFAVGSDLFAEIAKLRAARLLWSKIAAAFGASEQARGAFIHARCSRHTKTARDPWVNMVRGTSEVLAAAVGGADAVTALPFDAALGGSPAADRREAPERATSTDPHAQRLARNTQLVLRDESHLHRSIDPAGGSWYVEALTDRLARAAWERVRNLERGGGMVRALRLGRVAREVQRVAAKRREAVARRSAPIVGISEYPDAEEQPLTRPDVDLEDLDDHMGRAFGEADVRSRYDVLLLFSRLASGQQEGAPGEAAKTAVEAARAGVDLFSLGSVMRSKRPSLCVEPLVQWRASEPWEALRQAAETYAKIRGRRPRGFLANLGPISEHRARADFAFNLLAAGGIEPLSNDGFDTAEQVAGAYQEAEADLAVICGSDLRYGQMAEGVAKALSAAGAKPILLAGQPGEHEEQWRGAGVAAFVYRSADVLELLQQVQRDLGVSK